MLRALVLATLVLAAGAAGCIAPPQEETTSAAASELPPAAPDGRITREERGDATTEEICPLGGISLPQPSLHCATRVVAYGGDLTLTTLPVALRAGFGDVVVEAGEKGAWSLDVLVTARGETPDAARAETQKIETTVSVEDMGFPKLDILVKGPDGSTRAQVDVLLRLPAETLYAMDVDTGSGDLRLSGLRTSTTTVHTGSGDATIGGHWLASVLAASSGSGDLEVDADATVVELETGSGDVAATLRAIGPGAITVSTGSGEVALRLPEESDRGYDLTATTGSGDIEIGLKDGRVDKDGDERARFLTSGYARRPIRTVTTISTGSGDVAVTPA